MKAILREEKSGVSEILGTILILGITVTLFSVIIVWVSGIPTPTAQTRVDLASSMVPVLDNSGTEIGVNITLTHKGGESLYPVPTVIYVTDERGSNPQTTDVVTLHLFNSRLANPNGLLDGQDSVWSIGERWGYVNYAYRTTDSITVTIVDTSKGTVEWTGQMNMAMGARPPVFLNVWTAGALNQGQANTVYAGSGFYLFANVISPDNDLNPNSVFATIMAWAGSSTGCELPLQMHDDGVSPDQVAGDQIFSLGGNPCMKAPYPAESWSGSYILLNATDMQGRQAQTRFVLDVAPNPTTITNTQTIPSQLWQYIGYVQIRTGEVWVTNLSQPYATASTYQPYRVLASTLNNNGGALFHLKMANHGNTTIFIDGWTEAFLQNTQSSSGFAMYIVAPCSPTTNANAGGVAAYPGTTSTLNDFEYARPGFPSGCNNVPPSVFDINVVNQEQGGTPYTVLVYDLNPFQVGRTKSWQSASYFMSILVSGMAGPVNYTYAMLLGNGPNPYACTGLGPNYNPINHLNDPRPACRTQWYAQVIPFIGMVVY